MDLLKEYEQTQRTYWMMEGEFKKQLEPYKKRVHELRDKLELTILKDRVYMPYEEMIKFSGRISRVNMIIQYGDGYQKIERFLFNCFDLEDGKLIDRSVYPARFMWVKNNKYIDSTGEEFKHEIFVLGCYDLEVDGVPIFDSQLKVLWNKSNK